MVEFGVSKKKKSTTVSIVNISDGEIIDFQI